jgi:hypothetical protein
MNKETNGEEQFQLTPVVVIQLSEELLTEMMSSLIELFYYYAFPDFLIIFAVICYILIYTWYKGNEKKDLENVNAIQVAKFTSRHRALYSRPCREQFSTPALMQEDLFYNK